MRYGTGIALVLSAVLPAAGARAEPAPADRCVELRMFAHEAAPGWSTSRADVPQEVESLALADPDGAGRQSIFLHDRAASKNLRADLRPPRLQVSPYARVPKEIDFARFDGADVDGLGRDELLLISADRTRIALALPGQSGELAVRWQMALDSPYRVPQRF